MPGPVESWPRREPEETGREMDQRARAHRKKYFESLSSSSLLLELNGNLLDRVLMEQVMVGREEAGDVGLALGRPSVPTREAPPAQQAPAERRREPAPADERRGSKGDVASQRARRRLRQWEKHRGEQGLEHPWSKPHREW